jgi:hypothetical protein
MMVFTGYSCQDIPPAMQTKDCKYRYSKGESYEKNNLIKKEKRGKI